MLDHVTFGVADFARSAAFYDRALAPLGIKRLFMVPLEHTGGVEVAGYGVDRPFFWIAGADGVRGKLHLALAAPDRAAARADVMTVKAHAVPLKKTSSLPG